MNGVWRDRDNDDLEADAEAEAEAEAYEVSIELIGALRELLPVIKRHDRDLADQIHRAATSVALNLGEGARFTTGNAGATSRSRKEARWR